MQGSHESVSLTVTSVEDPLKDSTTVYVCVLRFKRKSLKILGTVGEPINPEAWQWYYNVVGEKRCPIVDTFWQTETVGSSLFIADF